MSRFAQYQVMSFKSGTAHKVRNVASLDTARRIVDSQADIAYVTLLGYPRNIIYTGGGRALGKR